MRLVYAHDEFAGTYFRVGDAGKSGDISTAAAVSDFIGLAVLRRNRSTPVFRLSCPLAHGFAASNY